MKYIFSILVAAFVLSSCGDDIQEKSETMKQAEQVHEQVIQLSGDLADLIHSKTDNVASKLEEYTAAGDSVMASKLEGLSMKLDDLHGKFHSVETGIVEIPGHEHTHAEGEEHDHDHDHAKNAIMDGLTDDQHLEIQTEQKNLLEELKAEVESIIVE
jgi:hypothetical protein